MKTRSFYDLYGLLAEEDEKKFKEEFDFDEDANDWANGDEPLIIDHSGAEEPSVESAKKMENVDNNYCQESNMQQMVLEKIFPGKKWIHNKTIPGAPRRTRPDFRCEELKLIVEYNGHRHYTQAKTIVADIEKKKMYEKMGYTVVEWPYWLQPDKITVSTMFGMFRGRFSQHFCNYHQGFVAKDCVLPADFCELGVERYNYELSQQDPHTIIRVDWSLRNKEMLYGRDSVWCSNGGLIRGGEYYIDGTTFWWRKVHSFGYDESIEIGKSIL